MFGKRIDILAASAAVFTGGVLALSAPAAVSAESQSVQEIMVKTAAEAVLAQTEPAVEEFRKRAMDPTGADAIITASGKVLTRDDGKWITPGSGRALTTRHGRR